MKTALFLNLLIPQTGDIIECLSISYIIHKENSMTSLIIRTSNSHESFLASCVPNLQLYNLFVHLKGFDFEINPNRRKKTLIEHVIRKPY